jgi:hypothetical protein
MNKLVTKHYKLKDLDKKKAETLSKRFGIKDKDLEAVYKGLSCDKSEVDESERTVLKYVSTISVDRDGDIIDPDGIDTSDFEKNPVILYGHNHGSSMWGGGYPVLPLGRDRWIKRTKKGLLALQEYASHDLANDVFTMHKDGFPLASSIGFIPLEYKEQGDDDYIETATKFAEKYNMNLNDVTKAQRIYTKTYLLEHSDVPVPSNPDALMLSVKGGNIKFNSENLIKDLELGEEEMEQEIAKINECLAKMQKTLDTLVKNIIEKQEPSEEPEEPEEEVDTLTIDDVKALLAENNKHLKEEIAKLTGKV